MSEIERLRRLVAHRELQLLRATAVRTRGGIGWVRERRRKLDEAERALKRAERVAAFQEQEDR